MKLNCLGCGNPVSLGEEYEDYSGSIRCNACSAILKVTLKESKYWRWNSYDLQYLLLKRPLKEGYSSPQSSQSYYFSVKPVSRESKIGGVYEYSNKRRKGKNCMCFL